MPRLKPLLISTGVILLLGAVAIQFIAARQPVVLQREPLNKIVPSALPGWTVKDVPLAETQEGRTAVESILRYDDYVSRSYRNGSTEVTVYVAYWRPDRMPPRMVGRHTPDRCWIENGWTCESRSRAVTLLGTQGPLRPAEMGTYVFKQQARLYVAFWHLVGGEVYAYGPEQSDMVVFALWKDLHTFGLKQRQQQLFIRIASNTPLKEAWHDPSLRNLLTAIENLGVRL